MSKPHEHRRSFSPLMAEPCHCAEPVGDMRDMTCVLCGRQVDGAPIPSASPVRALGDHSTAARKVFRGGPGSGLRAA